MIRTKANVVLQPDAATRHNVTLLSAWPRRVQGSYKDIDQLIAAHGLGRSSRPVRSAHREDVPWWGERAENWETNEIDFQESGWRCISTSTTWILLARRRGRVGELVLAHNESILAPPRRQPMSHGSSWNDPDSQRAWRARLEAFSNYLVVRMTICSQRRYRCAMIRLLCVCGRNTIGRRRVFLRLRFAISVCD